MTLSKEEVRSEMDSLTNPLLPPVSPSSVGRGGDPHCEADIRSPSQIILSGAFNDLRDNLSAEEIRKMGELPFRAKHLWFEYQLDRLQVPWNAGHFMLEVSRTFLLQSSVDQFLYQSPTSVRQRMRVVFIGEPGLDVGGIQREWFLLVIKELLTPGRELYRLLPGAMGYSIDPRARRFEQLELFEFTGRILGKAILERQSLPATFSSVLYKHILRAPLTEEDLRALDPELHKHILWLRKNSTEGLDLDFTVSRDHSTAPVELKPGGKHIAVTEVNKQEYITLLVRWHLVDAVDAQLWHLLRGLYTVIPWDLLLLWDHAELEFIICGTQSIDVDDWRRHTEYVGGFSSLGDAHEIVEWFWSIVKDELDEDQRTRLLQFCTGSSRVPAQGFKSLQRNDGKYQRFTLENTAGHEENNTLWLPQSHTCFNRLDLPTYKKRADLKDALVLVLEMDVTGFSMD
eukprot:CAMPEP_0185796510 /NCGR_PEP_ID=MMETSP1174-20130828/161123_1 /TAXON_ID=35687 /ORGANISM="Dictyocha speculum, Strain CCMP1381" /LENGTH=456 /DNA_ID=CAMNT_0028491883 /DNA_START=671 /DNA_END=2041 /DNA_ORIENTATION=+